MRTRTDIYGFTSLCLVFRKAFIYFCFSLYCLLLQDTGFTRSVGCWIAWNFVSTVSGAGEIITTCWGVNYSTAGFVIRKTLLRISEQWCLQQKMKETDHMPILMFYSN